MIEFRYRALTSMIGIVVAALVVLSIRIRHKNLALLELVQTKVNALLLWSDMGTMDYPQSTSLLAPLVMSQTVEA